MLTARQRIIFAQQNTPQAQQFLSRTIALDSRHARAASTLINNLVQQGIWQLMDGFYIFATQDTNNANLNWVNANYPMALVAAGATFTADQGYTTTATSVLSPGFGTTPYVPSTKGVNLTLNSASIGTYCLTNSTLTCFDCGGGSTADIWASGRDNNLSIFTVNDTDVTTGTVMSQSSGLVVATRTDSGNKNLFGPTGSPTVFRTLAIASTAVANAAPYIGARNAGGINNASSRQYAAFVIGGGMLGPQYAALSFFVNQYMKTMGCSVYT